MKITYKWILISVLTILLIPNLQAVDWVPFELRNGHITIEIEFNGEPGTAVLDTGAEMNAVSGMMTHKYADDFSESKKIRVQGVNGIQERYTFSNIPVKIFGVELTMHKMVEMNLAGNAILLGAPFFQNFITQVDYPNQRMRILPRDAVDMKAVANLNIKQRRGGYLPAVNVDINGKSTWLLLDTGSTGGLYISRKLARENNWIPETVSEGYSIGVNKIAETAGFNISSLKIGPYELENIPTRIPAEGEKDTLKGKYGGRSTGSHLGKGAVTHGLLGYDVLKHFVLTIDYRGYKAHIVAP